MVLPLQPCTAPGTAGVQSPVVTHGGGIACVCGNRYIIIMVAARWLWHILEFGGTAAGALARMHSAPEAQDQVEGRSLL